MKIFPNAFLFLITIYFQINSHAAFLGSLFSISGKTNNATNTSIPNKISSKEEKTIPKINNLNSRILTNLCGIESNIFEFVELEMMVGIDSEYKAYLSAPGELLNFQKYVNLSEYLYRKYPRKSWSFFNNTIRLFSVDVNADKVDSALIDLNSNKTSNYFKFKTFLKKENIYGNICHWNKANKELVCIFIDEKEIKVSKMKNYVERTTKFEIPSYLIFSEHYSYSDKNGNNFLVMRSTLSWIYVFNLDQASSKNSFFLKAFQFSVPDNYIFVHFEYVDEFGVFALFKNEFLNINRYYYSIFDEETSMKSFCIYEGLVELEMAFFVKKLRSRENESKQIGTAEALRQVLGIKQPSTDQFRAMFWLFIISLTYLIIFITTYFFEVKKVSITRDLQFMEKEITKLSTVIEPLILKVNQFLKENKPTK